MSCLFAFLIPEHWSLVSAENHGLMGCSFLCLVLLLGHLLSEFAEESLRLQEILCCPSLNIFKHIHLRAKVTGAKFRDREA